MLFGRSTRVRDVEIAIAKLEHQSLVHRGINEKLLERLEASEKAVEAQGSTIRLLKNEWEDVLDRANRVMGRLNARIRKFEGQNEPESDAESGPQGPTPIGTHAALAARRGR